MSRAIEAACLFAVGVIAGGTIVYTTRKSLPPPPPPKQATPVQKDIAVAEIVPDGSYTHKLI
jgi:hypothetical protein